MPHHYFKIFKPYGYVSQFITNDRHAKRKKFLGEFYNFPEGTMAVGRLDEPSEGLLLLTTDGNFSHSVRKKDIEKEYYVQVDGEITDQAIKNLQNGVTITNEDKDYVTLPSKVSLFKAEPNLPERAKKIRDSRHGPTSWISVTVTEGKFRQVRKMTSAVGFPTLRLVRFRIGNITIDGMASAEVVEISETSIFKIASR